MVVQLTRLLSLTGHLNYCTDGIKSSERRLLLYEIRRWRKLAGEEETPRFAPVIIFARVISSYPIFSAPLLLLLSRLNILQFHSGFSTRYNVLSYRARYVEHAECLLTTLQFYQSPVSSLSRAGNIYSHNPLYPL